MPISTEDRFIELTDQSIDSEELTKFVTTPRSGAVILFLGTVRELTRGKKTIALDYDAYPQMALVKMNELVDEAAEKWPIQKVAIVHRTGHLELAEASVAIAVSCPHRGDTFDAGRFLIDELKIRVPVWKKENWDDGTTEWVHPGEES
ncbi:molybdenum cofactor biosynthesis protein MoaE [Planctomicrobium sp.]|nr:molybdenum cofactor biosynthesis protein MoaE [Planctomicrobium sp.]MDB4733731.1 molybdenum cofactor biosynthesis protein MoaE [Planctomicrobium sp.]